MSKEEKDALFEALRAWRRVIFKRYPPTPHREMSLYLCHEKVINGQA